MIAPRTVPRHVTPIEVRNDALEDARARTEELVTLLQVPGPHVSSERTLELCEAGQRALASLRRLDQAQMQVERCACTCPTYTPETRRAVQEAIDQRMRNDIGPSSYEAGAWGEMLP